jgi:hypothetical protein
MIQGMKRIMGEGRCSNAGFGDRGSSVGGNVQLQELRVHIHKGNESLALQLPETKFATTA